TALVVLRAAPVASPAGDVDGVLFVGHDLTEIRGLQEQVIQAEKLATLGELAAGVVHELNNPLTSITVYSDYLLKKYESAGADPGDAEKLRRIVQSAERILRLARDLVAYARPSTDRPAMVDIHEILEQSIVFCEHVLGRHSTIVQRKYSEQLPPVRGVKDQL